MNNPLSSYRLEAPDDNDWEAYVGLREKGGIVTLRVPHGYPEGNDVKDAPQILGELTRAVMRFSEVFSDAERSSYDGCSTRDGLLKADGGQSFNFDSKDAELGYTHFARYRQLIRMLRDPRLLAATKAPGLTTQFDHRYIARNLERAMFLADGTPVFDLSWAPRTQMRHTGNDMVGLACWMALDAVKILFPNSADHQIAAALQSEWDELAHRFAGEHELDADASLFSGKRHDTLPLLQTALETCTRLAPPVSSDARELHHLLDELLHYALNGQDGEICGLQGFYHVWESACLEYAIDNLEEGDKVFTCDQTYLLGRAPKEWNESLVRVFAKHGLERHPDLVIKKADGTYLVIDFKYYAADEAKNKFTNKPPSPPGLELLKTNPAEFARQWKPYQDIASVEAYRWRLMQYELKSIDASKVKIELWVPDLHASDGYPCKWMDGVTLDDKPATKILTLVGKPAREILSSYANKFRLMD